MLSSGPDAMRSRVVEEHVEEVPAAGCPRKSQQKELSVQQTIETLHMQLLGCPADHAAPCWRDACTQVITASCIKLVGLTGRVMQCWGPAGHGQRGQRLKGVSGTRGWEGGSTRQPAGSEQVCCTTHN